MVSRYFHFYFFCAFEVAQALDRRCAHVVAGDFEFSDAAALCGRLNNQLQSKVGHVCVVQVETGDAAALQQVGRDVRVHEIM